MVQRDAAAPVLIAGLGQPAMPAHQIVPPPVQERLGDRAGGPAAAAGVVEDALHRDRVHRRLGDAGGVPGPRRIGGQRRAGPAGRPGKVAVDPAGEHDVRDHPVGPLRRQQRVEFDDGALDAQRRQSDRDERRVPAPHVRVQQRRGGRHHTQVVAAQQVGGAGRELRRGEAGIGSHASILRRARADRATKPTIARGPRVSGMPTALITGAGGGLGAAIADALAPTHTLLLAGRPSARARRRRRAARRHRPGRWTSPTPTASRQAAESLAELDVLVHNAGVALPGTRRRVVCRRVARHHGGQCHWRRRPHAGAAARRCAASRGHVVFINSGAGRNPSPGLASYSASKFALRAFADSLRADEPALRVTTVLPRPHRHRHAARPGGLRGRRLRPGAVPETRDGRAGGRRCGRHPARRRTCTRSSSGRVDPLVDDRYSKTHCSGQTTRLTSLPGDHDHLLRASRRPGRPAPSRRPARRPRPRRRRRRRPP